MHIARLTWLFLTLAASGLAYAEVMDKEPSLMQNTVWGLVGSALCLLVARFKPWLLLVVVPLPAFYFLSLLSEIHDPFVRPAMLSEAGKLYICNAYGLGGLMLASIFSGLWWRTVKVQEN
jgi:hypothetical protein